MKRYDVILFNSDEQPYCATLLHTSYADSYLEYFSADDFKGRHADDNLRIDEYLSQTYFNEHPRPESEAEFENDYLPKMSAWADEAARAENLVNTARKYPDMLEDEEILPNEPKAQFFDESGTELKYKEVEVYTKCGAVFLKTGDNLEDISYLCLTRDAKIYADFIRKRFEDARQEYLENEPF